MLIEKKGNVGNMAMFFSFMFLLVMIGAGIVIGVYMFFGSGYDFREVEAEMLSYKIKSCILNNDIDNLFEEEKEFFETCKLNRDVIKEYGIVKICEGRDCINSEKSLFFSGSNFQSCRFLGAKGNEAYPRCFEEVFVISQELEEKEISMVIGSNQRSRRVSI